MSKRKRTDNTEVEQTNKSDVDYSDTPIQQRLDLETERFAKLSLLNEQKQHVAVVQKEVDILTGSQNNKVQPSSNNESQNNRKKILEKNASDLVAIQDEDARVKVNVGGQTFVTSRQTLSNEETIFKIMLTTSLPIDKDENGAIIVEEGRTPDNFVIILDYLRSRKLNAIGLPIDDVDRLKRLLEDSDYYGTAKLSNYIRQLIQDKIDADISLQTKKRLEAEREVDEEDFEIPNDEDTTKKRDEEWMDQFSHMTLEQSKIEKKYFNEELTKLDKQKQIVEKEKHEIISKVNNTPDKRYMVRLNVGGREFEVDLSVLVKQTDSIFVKAFEKLGDANKNILFIDRDPDLFAYILEYLKTEKTTHLPFVDASRSRQIREEAKYYNISGLIEFFDPLRYPIETIGEENIKMKHSEDAMRRLFATDRQNPLLDDPYLSLLPVFTDIKDSFAAKNPPTLVPLMFNFEKSLDANDRPPLPQLTDSIQTFERQFDAFTSGLFQGVDWSNMFAAGGSVLASAMAVKIKKDNRRYGSTPFDDLADVNVTMLYGDDDDLEDVEVVEFDDDQHREAGEDVFTDSDLESESSSSSFGIFKQNKKEKTIQQRLSDHYESSVFNGSDIDLFLYDLTEDQAEKKIEELYNLFKINLEKVKEYNSLSSYYIGDFPDGVYERGQWHKDVFMIRTKQAITFHFTYPIRPIQIILRIYKSPAEILMGFDLDCCTIGYDGKQVWALPRARRAISTRMNLIDVDRQSTTYEVRLFKYAKRGFRVGVPGYDVSKIKNSVLIDDELYSTLTNRLDYKKVERKYRTISETVVHSYQKKKNFKERHGLARLILFERSITRFKNDNMFSSLYLTGCYAPNSIDSIEYEVKDVDYKEERERSYERAKKAPVAVDQSYGYTWRRRRRASKNPGYVKRHKASDYAVLFIPFSKEWVPTKINERFTGSIQFIKDVVKKDYLPDFIYSLNDVSAIIKGNAMESELMGPIDFLTINPGTQAIGSFNPVDTNFYQDAYERTDEQREVLQLTLKEKNEDAKSKAKKYVRITWTYENKNEEPKSFDMTTNAKIERAYREYKKKGADKMFNLSENQYVNFKTKTLETSVANKKQFVQLKRQVVHLVDEAEEQEEDDVEVVGIDEESD